MKILGQFQEDSQTRNICIYNGYRNFSILDFVGAKGDGRGSDSCSYKSCKAPVTLSSSSTDTQLFYTLAALPDAQPTVSEH